MRSGLIKKAEGFRAHPYLDDAKVPTIGYGMTFWPDITQVVDEFRGKKVTLKDPEITESFAAFLLDWLLENEYRPIIRKYVSTPLNINQKEAIESLTYNLGVRAFRNKDGSKTMLSKSLDRHDFYQAALNFKWFINAGGKHRKGLSYRRHEEAVLFSTAPYKSISKGLVDEVEDADQGFWSRLLNFIKKGDDHD